ncbi:hypothetical protein [Caenispirillum salinarum]
MEFRAGIKNVLNEEYYHGGTMAGIAFRGQPRTVFATLTARF